MTECVTTQPTQSCSALYLGKGSNHRTQLYGLTSSGKGLFIEIKIKVRADFNDECRKLLTNYLSTSMAFGERERPIT